MTATTTAPLAAAALREPGIPLARLTRVELRKLADTRAGFWLLLTLALLIVGTATIYLLTAEEADLTFTEIFRVIQWPISVLLPILGILSVTSEWSQRTALTTFTLVPDRLRVVAAKVASVVVLTLAALAVSLVAAAIANLAGGHGWAFGADTLGEIFLFQLTGLLGGLAFGLALQSSAPAIVLYFVAPTIVSIIATTVSALKDAAVWLDLGQTTTPIAEGTANGTEWAQFGTSAAVWVLVPLLIGLWRLPRSELK